MEAHNLSAGQGAVVLDIGGDIGALIVDMPPRLAGVEIEIRPVGGGQAHQHAHDHHHEPGDHSHAHPHVAVVARPTDSGLLPSLVFGELTAGEYELYQRPAGPVQLQATVRGGEVTQASWPD